MHLALDNHHVSIPPCLDPLEHRFTRHFARAIENRIIQQFYIGADNQHGGDEHSHNVGLASTTRGAEKDHFRLGHHHIVLFEIQSQNVCGRITTDELGHTLNHLLETEPLKRVKIVICLTIAEMHDFSNVFIIGPFILVPQIDFVKLVADRLNALTTDMCVMLFLKIVADFTGPRPVIDKGRCGNHHNA